MTPDICSIQDTNCSSELHSARLGQVHEIEQKLRLLRWTFWFFFRRKIKIHFCQLFVGSFICSPCFSGVTKYKYTSKSFLLEHCILWSPHWGECQKAQLVMHFLEYTRHVCPKLQTSVLYPGLSRYLSAWGQLFQGKVVGFFPCIGILLIRKFQKKINFDSSPYSNS